MKKILKQQLTRKNKSVIYLPSCNTNEKIIFYLYTLIKEDIFNYIFMWFYIVNVNGVQNFHTLKRT